MPRVVRRIVRAKVVARAKTRPRPVRAVARPKPAPKKFIAVRRVPAKPVAAKKPVLRLVKKPAPSPSGIMSRAGARAGAHAEGKPPLSQDADDLQDDDESPSDSEPEDVGPDDSGESTEDSGSESEGDEGEGESESGDEVEGLIDVSNLDPVKAIVLGWVLFGVTLSTAMAIGWSIGKKQHAHARR